MNNVEAEEELKIVKIVSHLENDFQAAVKDAQWFRRRRRERKAKKSEARKPPVARPGVVLISFNSDDEEEVEEICVPVPLATTPVEVVNLEDGEVTVNPSNGLDKESYKNGGSEALDESSDETTGGNNRGSCSIDQFKGEVGVADQNGGLLCQLEGEERDEASSPPGALVIPAQDSDGLGNPGDLQQLTEVTSLEALEEPDVHVEEKKGDDKTDESLILDVNSPSRSADGNSIEKGVPSVSSDGVKKNRRKDKEMRRMKKRNPVKTGTHLVKYISVLDWSFTYPVIVKRKSTSSPSTKEQNLSKKALNENNSMSDVQDGSCSASASIPSISPKSASSLDSGFVTDENESQIATSQDDAEVGKPQYPEMATETHEMIQDHPAEMMPPSPEMATETYVMYQDDAADGIPPSPVMDIETDQMPFLHPQPNEQTESCSNPPGIDEDSDSDGNGGMPILTAQISLGDNVVCGMDLMEESWMEEDSQKTDQEEIDAPEIVMKKRRSVLTKENGVVILNLQEASSIFCTRVWCKLCDTFFRNIEELRSHLMVVHNINGEKVTKKNEATWDLPIARTYEDPLKLEYE